MNKKILLYYPWFKSDHILKDRWQLLKFLHEHYHTNAYILCEKMSTTYDLDNTWIVEINYLKRYNLYWYCKTLFRIKPDILLIYYFQRFNIALILLYKIIRPRGKIYLRWDIYYSLTQASRLKLFKYNIILRFYNLTTDLLSVETSYIQEYIISKFPFMKWRVEYIPNWIDPLTEYRNSEKENIILSIGRFRHQAKNLELLLETIKSILIENSDRRFIWIGEVNKDWADKKLEKFLTENTNIADRVNFVWKITDRKKVESYLNSAKVYLWTSNRESFGLSLLEAAYYGCVVISTDVWCMKDITNNYTIISTASIWSKQDLLDLFSASVWENDVWEKFHKHAKKYFLWSNLIYSIWCELNLESNTTSTISKS